MKKLITVTMVILVLAGTLSTGCNKDKKVNESEEYSEKVNESEEYSAEDFYYSEEEDGGSEDELNTELKKSGSASDETRKNEVSKCMANCEQDYGSLKKMQVCNEYSPAINQNKLCGPVSAKFNNTARNQCLSNWRRKYEECNRDFSNKLRTCKERCQ